MIQTLPGKDNLTYIIQPEPSLSPREQKRVRTELLNYGAQERLGVITMNAWLLWNYQKLVHNNPVPPTVVQQELDRRRPWLSSEHALRLKDILTPDQWRWVEYFHLNQEKAGANFSDPGVGKSIQAIAALMVENPNTPVLVVTIKGCKRQWVGEFEKLGYEGPVTVYDGKQFTLPEKGVVIVNWENLPPLAKEGLNQAPLENFLLKIPKGLYVIGDEIQKTKNYASKMTKRWRKLTSEVLKRGGKLIGLTATPVENKAQEIWSVMSGLGLQKQAFGNYDHFCYLYGGQMNRWLKIMEFHEDQRKVDELRARLATTLFRITRDKTRERLEREVLVDIKANKALDQLEAESASLTDQETLKLALKFENLAKIKTALAKEKQKAAMELIDTLAEQGPLLVYGGSVEAIQAIGKRKGWAYITGDVSAADRDRIKNQFNAGELTGLAFTDAGGVGANYPIAQNMVVLDLSYSFGKNKQALGRNDRHNTKHSILNYYFVLANHPFDKRLQRLYREKTRLYEDTLET